MLSLYVDSSLDDCLGLHLSDFRISNSQTAATVTHHRVEFVQRSDDSLDLINSLALCISQLLDIFFFSRYEFVERRIQEPDGNRVAFQSFIQSFKVALLHRFDLSQSSFSFFNGVRADHFTECCDSVSFEEHVFGTAQTDTFSTQFTSLLRISRSICIGTNLHGSVLVCPAHNSAECTSDRSINSRDDTVIDVTSRTVDRDIVAFCEGLASQFKLLVFFVHLDVAATGYAASTHTTSNNGSVRSHTATNSQDTLRSLHTGDVFRRSFQTNQNNLFALSVPSFCIISSKYNLTASSTRRSTQTLADRCSSLQSLCIELRVEQGVEVSRIDHQNSFFFGLVLFIYEVASDLESSLSGSLTIPALQHVQLLVFYCEFHILHIVIVVFQCLANLNEFSVCFREFLFHLCDRHRSPNTGNNVFALCVDQEFTHQLLFTSCWVTGKCNTSTGFVVQVTEYHRHYVNSSTPRIRNIVVTTVNVCSRVVPATEYSFDCKLQLFNRIRREVRTQLLLVFSLELFSQRLQISSSQFYVELYALFFLHLVDQLFEVLLTNFHNNVGEHLNESSVRVIYEPFKSRIRIAFDHCSNNVVIQTEVQDGVHHTRHGSTSTRTNGNQQRVLLIAELLAVDFFHLLNAVHNLCHDFVVDLAAIFIVLGTSFCGDGEALRYRKTDCGHFSQVCTLASEQVPHGHVAFAEHINPFVCHW